MGQRRNLVSRYRHNVFREATKDKLDTIAIHISHPVKHGKGPRQYARNADRADTKLSHFVDMQREIAQLESLLVPLRPTVASTEVEADEAVIILVVGEVLLTRDLRHKRFVRAVRKGIGTGGMRCVTKPY